jgi:diguanylate cyclase (GGDEF)-like protein
VDILSHAERAQVAAPEYDALESELVALRAQVASLQSERAALWWDINHDDLTGLANRRMIVNVGPSVLNGTGRCAVVVLDLNGFKPINDQYGHAAGDDVLRTVARRLTRCLGDELTVRLSGDEFAAILTESSRPDRSGDWTSRVAAIAAAIAEPMVIDGHPLRVTASIGVATTNDGPATIDELLRRADLAMYRAKADRYCSNVVWD